MSLIVLNISFLFCHVFNNRNSILQRAGKFIGKNPCSNLSYHLAYLRQNEGYFLVKGQVSIILGNSFIPGKAPALPQPLSLPPALGGVGLETEE